MKNEEEIITNLFQQARNEKLETDHREVYRWIGYFSIPIILGSWFSKFKVLITKSIVMYTTILASTIVTVGVFVFNETQNKSVKDNTAESLISVERTNPKITNKLPPPLAWHEDQSNTEPMKEKPKSMGASQDYEPIDSIETLETRTTSEQFLEDKSQPPKAQVLVSSLSNSHQDFGPFTKLEVTGAIKIVLVQEGFQGVRYEGGDIENMPFKVENKSGTLYVSPSRGGKKNGTLNELIISVDNLQSLAAGGPCRISTKGNYLKLANLELITSDASRVDIHLNLNALKITSSDASRITLHGSAARLDMTTSDATRISAFGFNADDVSILSSDASRIEVSVLGTLKIRISDACAVAYKGSPKSIDKTTSDAAKVTHID